MANQLTDRDNRIITAALELAAADGYQWITRAGVASKAGVATGTINGAFGDMRGLKRAVLHAAIERGVWAVVAQGLGDQHPIVMSAPAEVKAQAAALLMGA